MDASHTGHKEFNDPCLPYYSYGSDTATQPVFRAGSNVITSLQEQLERRPGFSAAVETAASAFGTTAKIRNTYTWRRWSSSTSGIVGAYITMVNVTDSTVPYSRVYKYQHGTDVTLSLLFTCTGSSLPFYFTEFNNHVAWNHHHSGCTPAQIYDGTGVVSWGITRPASAPTYTISTASGSLQAYDKYYYRQTLWDANRGHESSPSALSACTGIFGPGTVNGTALAASTADASRVTHYRIYRTTDGGSDDPTLMQEITGSPFAIGTLTWTDTTADADLGIRTAPALSRNDPPTAMDGFCQHAGRVAGFSGSTLYYSGNEEISNGIREECWPGGLDGNSRPYASEINAVAATASGIAIFQATRIDAIDGDRLDSFFFYKLAAKQGTKSQFNVVEFGGIVFWLDTMNTIWMLGGNEIAIPIRTDLANIDQSQTQLCIHLAGSRRWLLVLDAAAQRIYPYDFDTDKWMPPWTASGYSLSSGETATGVFTLMLGAQSGRLLKAVEGTYNDNGTPYTASVTTSLLDLTPDSNPEWRASLKVVNIDSMGTTPTVSMWMDDVNGTAISLTRIDATLRTTQGTTLQSYDYNALNSTGRRVQLKFDWAAVDESFVLESFYIGFQPIGR